MLGSLSIRGFLPVYLSLQTREVIYDSDLIKLLCSVYHQLLVPVCMYSPVALKRKMELPLPTIEYVKLALFYHK